MNLPVWQWEQLMTIKAGFKFGANIITGLLFRIFSIPSTHTTYINNYFPNLCRPYCELEL